jgi:hypothetical protein
VSDTAGVVLGVDVHPAARADRLDFFRRELAWS